jgi:hypothetical protein
MEQHIAVSARTRPRGLRPISAHYIGEEFPLIHEIRTGAGARPPGTGESHSVIRSQSYLYCPHFKLYQQLNNIAVHLAAPTLLFGKFRSGNSDLRPSVLTQVVVLLSPAGRFQNIILSDSRPRSLPCTYISVIIHM